MLTYKKTSFHIILVFIRILDVKIFLFKLMYRCARKSLTYVVLCVYS
jgi:hypothetical protein